MFFALLTLLTAISLAAVAGWFSIVGFMTIYAGAPFYALVMGAVTEVAKLVTTSWLYRNWQYTNWKLKLPLLYFTLALMTATSIGVFGFLSKAHIEQGADKIDNSSKIETLQFQIDREKALIADNEKVIAQLDATVNSFLGRERADRALAVRRSQAKQRDELRKDSAAAQKRIDELSAEKFKLESEVRKLQLEVGPIRYIAEMIYGVEENSTKNIEAAVRIFTLLLVSTLDPLAVILLVAANHTLLRLKREKEEKKGLPASHRAELSSNGRFTSHKEENHKGITKNYKQGSESENTLPIHERSNTSEMPEIPKEISKETDEFINEKEEVIDEGKGGILHEETQEKALDQETSKKESIGERKSDNGNKVAKVHEEVSVGDAGLEKFFNTGNIYPTNFVHSPSITKIEKDTKITDSDETQPVIAEKIHSSGEKLTKPWAQQETVLRELLGNVQHFIPKRIDEEEKRDLHESDKKVSAISEKSSGSTKKETEEVSKERQDKTEEKGTSSESFIKSTMSDTDTSYKYPKTLGWLEEFRGKK